MIFRVKETEIEGANENTITVGVKVELGVPISGIRVGCRVTTFIDDVQLAQETVDTPLNTPAIADRMEKFALAFAPVADAKKWDIILNYGQQLIDLYGIGVLNSGNSYKNNVVENIDGPNGAVAYKLEANMGFYMLNGVENTPQPGVRIRTYIDNILHTSEVTDKVEDILGLVERLDKITRDFITENEANKFEILTKGKTYLKGDPGYTFGDGNTDTIEETLLGLDYTIAADLAYRVDGKAKWAARFIGSIEGAAVFVEVVDKVDPGIPQAFNTIKNNIINTITLADGEKTEIYTKVAGLLETKNGFDSIAPEFVFSGLVDDLDEDNIDGATVNIGAANIVFVEELTPEMFVLNNAPEGVTIDSVERVSDILATLTFAFDGTDFDVDVEDMTVTVKGAAIGDSFDYTTGVLTVAGLVESVLATPSGDPVAGLTEATLDGNVITLDLTNEEFANDPAEIGNYTLNNAPAGVTIASVNFVNAAQVELTLAFDGTDFAENVANFSITIAGAELAKGNALTTQAMLITALAESVSFTSAPTPLTEANLDGAVLTIDLVNEEFVEVISGANFQLNNAPAGTTIGTVLRISPTQATMILNFDNTDFDVDVTDFSITALGTGLSRGNSLQSPDVTITAVVE